MVPFTLALLPALVVPPILSPDVTSEPSKAAFRATVPSASPWVYWYFMEGNITHEGLKADLEAMKKAGIGGAIMLEVDNGIPKGPVRYMSPEWRSLVGYAIQEADRQGIAIALGTGPGWCGAGGPWVKPEDAMQNLVSSATEVTGPSVYQGLLPQPRPRAPFFGVDSMSPELRQQWQTFYKDEVVLAVPANQGRLALQDLDEKALYYRAPYSSSTVKSRLMPDTRTAKGISRVIDLTHFVKNGNLKWNVPSGRWTILRFGRTLAGNTTRPAPQAGLGFETDKFEKTGINAHLQEFIGGILKEAGPTRRPGRGLTSLHFDSWEMSSQNWSAHFRTLFKQHRGYDPVRYLPVLTGHIVDSVDVSERFLWDLRQTAQELVIENQVEQIKRYGHERGMVLDIEPYDMNPTSDLSMGAVADVPMGEFWSKGYGFDTEYSVDEAVSIAHTNGISLVGAESFTAMDTEAWLQHPGSMKAQTDWALATGINRIVFHRYQHQPDPNAYPGMTMGGFGVHWERTETWWDMVPAYHAYINRSQYLMRQGIPVADILYLVTEGAPNVFQPPADARIGRLPDRRSYNYDGCAPDTLIARASVKNGQIVFPDGTSYRVLVLPRSTSMTVPLLRKIKTLVDAGATVIGNLPTHSPSLVGYPGCDTEIARLSASLQGKLIPDTEAVQKPLGLDRASWIWSPEGNPSVSAPVGTQIFRKPFALPSNRPIASARMVVTADNTFRLTINGNKIAEGTDFHRVQQVDLTQFLPPGNNILELTVINEGNAPNPAGAILKLEIRFKDGSTKTIVSDGSWSNAKVLGNWQMAPWQLNTQSFPPPEVYPSYASTARLLSQKVRPDVASGEALRYGHRRLGKTDIYFVGNRQGAPYTGNVTFRAVGRPEWWDPMTGETRPLPQFSVRQNTTTIPLRLDGNGSGFVVFKPGPASPLPGKNFPEQKVAGTVSGPWLMTFEKRFGGPDAVTSDKLFDWKDSPVDSIKYYSGKAAYSTIFDGDKATGIDLGRVHNIASVRINGRDLGVSWCAPFTVSIPRGVLHPTGNRLEITVANLWVNRLIGDSALPQEKRVAKVSWSPYRPDSSLLPSGLLGPVRLLSNQ